MTASGPFADVLARAGLSADTPHETRQLGTDEAMIALIRERILIGEKTMTFSLPWLAERTGTAPPEAGRVIVTVDTAGRPDLVLRLQRVRRLAFGQVDASHLAREGLPMREPQAWRELHRVVWNAKLAPHGLEVSDDKPVWAEYFECLHPAPA